MFESGQTTEEYMARCAGCCERIKTEATDAAERTISKKQGRGSDDPILGTTVPVLGMSSTDGVHFTSGGHSNELAPRYDLIPACALRREADRMAEGAKDHGERNYEKGAGDAEFIRDRINHLLNHALLYASGDRSTDHPAAIRANAGMLMRLEEIAQS